jgi:hypothetical protein
MLPRPLIMAAVSTVLTRPTPTRFELNRDS